MTTTTDKPRRRAPGGGRKPKQGGPFDVSIKVRVPAARADEFRQAFLDLRDGNAVLVELDRLLVAWLRAQAATLDPARDMTLLDSVMGLALVIERGLDALHDREVAEFKAIVADLDD